MTLLSSRKRTRDNLLEQLGRECQCRGCPACLVVPVISRSFKCGSNIMLQIDHKIPMFESDKNARARDLAHPNLENLQLLCYPCHLEKSSRDGTH